ncbi:hypothetical protein P4U03_12425 [Bacillus mycoides]|uniref:Uncharacterized protein n=1 Tax=Bacillus thuringiensis serovar navarrensis TaxID=339658 RepID=A0A243A2R1_BACTU|nr:MULTISPECIES: DUF6572 domain-containing protein [Bacillus cereus group]MED1267418.1 hypothetical protein [Bacillus mycoides]OTY11575.1 hypothetical protein BK732_23015 [Bacillus thuringiensis serovar navarrensis]
MALHDIDQVDLISLDNNNKDIVYLTIFDALNWKEEHEHALLLQDKINNYLAFIESGEVYETTPETVGKNKFVIQVYALHELNAYGKEFYALLRDQLHAAGYGLQFNYRPSEEVENTEE